jgi:hypothetical protein
VSAALFSPCRIAIARTDCFDTNTAELKAVKALQKIEASTSGHNHAVQFELGKGELIADIEGGMAIRAFNQKVLPSSNNATAGLKTVEGAQQTELKLAHSLTGKAEHDRKTLATLVTDIENGTKQNKKNLAAVSRSPFALDFWKLTSAAHP